MAQNLSDRALLNMAHASTAIRSHVEYGRTILRPKQIPIVHSAASKLEENFRTIYFDLPTGVGKTVIFSQIVDAILRGGHQSRTLIVTDTKNLVEQIAEEFADHAPKVDLGLYYQHTKQLDKPAVVTTYASFPYFAENYANLFDYVIFDEGHKVLAENRLEQAQQFKNAVVMAFSASTAYSNAKDLDNHFELAYRMTVPEAIQSSLIAGYRNILVESDLVNLDSVKLDKDGNFNEQSLAKAVNIYSRNRSAAEFYLNEVNPYTGLPLLGKKGIVNCVDIQHAKDAAKVFRDIIPSGMIDGKDLCVPVYGKSKKHPGMTDKMRTEILEAHKNGEILLLTQSDLLIHGHNDKKIELTMNLDPTRSWVKALQRARSSRFDEENKKKVSLVIDFLDQHSSENKKGLLYGEVIGQSACLLPEMEESFIPDDTIIGKGRSYKDNAQTISNEYLSKLKITWNSEEVNSIIKSNSFENKDGLRLKQDDDLTIAEIQEITKLGYNTIARSLRKILDEWEAYNEHQDDRHKPLILVENIRMPSGVTALSIKRDQFEDFKDNYLKLLAIRNRTDSDLTILEIADKTGVSRAAVASRIRQISEDWKSYEEDPNAQERPSVRPELVRGKGGKSTWSIPSIQFDDFQKKYLSDFLLRKQTENDLTAPDIAKMAGMTPTTVWKSIDVLIKEWENYKNDSEVNRKPSIDLEYVQPINPGKSVLVVRKEQYDLFCSQYLQGKVLRSKTANDFSVKEIAQLTGVGVDIIRKTFDQIQTNWERYQEDTANVAKPLIEIETVKGSHPVTVITNDKLEIYKEEYLKGYIVPLKTNAHMVPPELAKKANVSLSLINRSFQLIQKEWDNYNEQPEKYEKPLIEFIRVKDEDAKKKIVSAISADHFELYREKYLSNSALRARAEDDLSISDISKLNGVSEKAIYEVFNLIQSQWLDWENDPSSYKKPLVKVEKIKSTGHPISVIKRDQLKILEQIYLIDKIARQKTENDLIIPEIMEATNSTVNIVKKRIELIRQQWIAHENDPENFPLPPVKVDKVRIRTGSVDSITKGQIPLFIEKYINEGPKKYMVATDIGNLANVNTTQIGIKLKFLAEQNDKYKLDSENNPKPSVIVEWYKPTKGKPVLAINEEDFERFKDEHLKEFIAREQTPNDLSVYDIASITGFSRGSIENTFNKIIAETEAHELDKSNQPCPRFKLDKVKNENGWIINSLPKDKLHDYQVTYLPSSLIRTKTNNDLIISDIAEIVGVSRSPVLDRFVRIKDELCKFDNGETAIQPPVKLEKVRGTGKAADSIHIEQLDSFVKVYFSELYDNFLQNKDKSIQAWIKKNNISNEPPL